MYKWSAKLKLVILKTVGGITLTVGIPYMQYYAKNNQVDILTADILIYVI